jgi:hypothetical protein
MSGASRVTWDRLFHAYGRASDTPLHLAALRANKLTRINPHSTDGYRYEVPYSYLWSALFGGGQLTPATPAAARLLAEVVAEPDFGGNDPTMREGVVYFFCEVGRVAMAAGEVQALRVDAAQRESSSVLEWLERYLNQPRPIYEWTDEDAPGRVLTIAAIVDCYDLVPVLYDAIDVLTREPWRSRTREVASEAATLLGVHPDIGRLDTEASP